MLWAARRRGRRGARAAAGDAGSRVRECGITRARTRIWWLRSVKALTEIGYVEGQNVAIEFLWAEGQLDTLPATNSRFGPP